MPFFITEQIGGIFKLPIDKCKQVWGHYFGKEYLAVADFDSRVKSEMLDSKESKSASKKRHEPER